MTITVLFFAATRERVGRDRAELKTNNTLTVSEVWGQSTGVPWPGKMLAAINQEYARSSDTVNDGDEVAFFPPVTGG